MSPRSLVGQSILVTGAGSGIGKVNAKLLVAGETALVVEPPANMDSM